jgi:hypothetical protein
MLKDVTYIYKGDIIHKILDFAKWQYLWSAPFYIRYHRVCFDGMYFYVSLNTMKVYQIYSS